MQIEAPNLPKPLVLVESANIIEYLTEHFGQALVPKRYEEGKEGVVGGESEEWLRFRHVMHYAEGSFMPVLITAMVIMSEYARNPPPIAHITSRGKTEEVLMGFGRY